MEEDFKEKMYAIISAEYAIHTENQTSKIIMHINCPEKDSIPRVVQQ